MQDFPPPALPSGADESREISDDLLIDALHRRALRNHNVDDRFPEERGRNDENASIGEKLGSSMAYSG